MKILAGEFLWLRARSVLIFPPAAYVKENSSIIQPFAAADECRVPAEYDQVAISSLFDLVETHAVALPVRGRRMVRVKPISQHFLRQYVNALKVFQRDSLPRDK